MSGHLCWSREPWYAADVWITTPGAGNIFELMLNGGWAWVPHQVNVYLHEEHASAILPVVMPVLPTIDDALPIHEGHGLWVMAQSTGVNTFSREETEDDDFEVTWNPVPDRTVVIGDLEHHLFSPWNVLPFLAIEFDEDGDAEINDNVTLELESELEMMDPEDADEVIDTFQTISFAVLNELIFMRDIWRDKLATLAINHDCAELLHADTAHSIYAVGS